MSMVTLVKPQTANVLVGGSKIEIQEIHQHLRNSLSIDQNPPSTTKSTSIILSENYLKPT